MPDGDLPGDPRIYIQLAVELRRRIAAGEIPRAGPAFTVTGLSAEFGHARQTCAKAIRVLVEEGLLTRYPGLGYFATAGARAPGA